MSIDKIIEAAVKGLPPGQYQVDVPGYGSVLVEVAPRPGMPYKRAKTTGGSRKSVCGCKGTRQNVGDPPPDISEALKYWRSKVTAYLAAVRKSYSPEDRFLARSELWDASVRLSVAVGNDISSWRFTPKLLEDAGKFWAGIQTVDGSMPLPSVLDVLAKAARAAATGVASQAKKGTLKGQGFDVWLLIVLKLMQLEAEINRPRPVKPSKPVKRTAKSPCDGRFDGIIACVRRSGGIKPEGPVQQELAYAAGDAKHVPPGVLRKSGAPFYKVASILTEQGFVRPDQHGRPDEAAALQAIVDAIRGGEGISVFNEQLNDPRQVILDDVVPTKKRSR